MNLNFDTGDKEFQINDDPNKVIRFNPNDLAFVERYENARDKAVKLAKKYEQQMKMNAGLKDKDKVNAYNAKVLKQSNAEVRDLINEVFEDDVADIIFGRVHPLTVVNGSFVVVNFLNALNEVIVESMNESMTDLEKTKISEYKEKYDSIAS